MKSGRKNLKMASKEEGLSPQDGQSVMQVVSLRGSNIIEVMDDKGVKFLALFPAKFQRRFWIKRGSFVVVDDGGRQKAIESGNKIACIVHRVLFHEQVRFLEKSPDWPAIFKNARAEDSNVIQQLPVVENADILNASSEDELPPLEANLNRNRPVEVYSDSDPDQDS
ncbi:F-box protein [Apostasia shenzhenica]|uniref:F-box protein n=1 Tax=Apostasia shenzhenica TaxID=1088818 RepID=A0A2I0A8I5_9ASPA|nr:F-box protein [Apostasia shenzhenica]